MPGILDPFLLALLLVHGNVGLRKLTVRVIGGEESFLHVPHAAIPPSPEQGLGIMGR